MYKSPIRIDYITRTSESISDIAESISDISESVERATIAKIQTIIDVDKYELIRALSYDRDQYKKGYKEGFKAAGRPKGEWIKHQAGLFNYYYCSICEKQAEVSNYCPNCGSDMREE